ncbi:MAG: hypothetical protein ABIQ11_04505 [Saprospiraceae bacterium]
MRSVYPYIIVIALFMITCKAPITQEELISKAIEIKLVQWQEEQRKECMLKAILDAEEFVDSLLIATSLQTKLDTIPKPPKPNKPMKPSFKDKPDTVVIDPILKKRKDE